MARISLSSAVSATYIRKLASAANSDAPSQAFRQPSNAANVDISSALRFGARVYSQGLQNLNSGISLLNIASVTMQKLIKITEDVVGLMERATAPGVGDQTRRRINSEFRDLATEFKGLVEDAQIGDYEVLDVESLTEFFEKIGLDPEESGTIADVFNKFLTRPLDTLLASEIVDNTKQVRIPSSAYTTNQVYALSKETDAALVTASGITGSISTNVSVYNAEDTTQGLEQNIFIKQADGSTSSLVAAEVAQLVSVQNQSGYSIVNTPEDLLGHNGGSLVNELFLVDSSGTVVQQLTNFNSAGVTATINGAAVSADGMNAIYSYFDSISGEYRVETVDIGAIGEDPTLSTRTLVEQNMTGAYTSVVMNNEGTYGAYIRSDTGEVYLRSSGGDGTQGLYLDDLSDARQVSFLTEDTVAVLRKATGDPSAYDYSIEAVEYDASGEPTPTILAQDLNVSEFATLQSSGSNYFSFIEDGQLRVYSDTTLLTAHTFGSSDTFDHLSMAFDSDGNPKVGVTGVIRSFNGDTDTELYTFGAGSSQSGRARKWEEIFDSSRTMVKKADAYQLLADAKDLLSMLENNKEALDEARDIIVSNAELLRGAGLAFLSVAGSLKGNETPEQIAFRLQSLIRQSGQGALSQLENLEPLTVKALLSDD